MITIDYTSLIIGACSVTLIVYLIWILKPKKKKTNIQNLRKLVYDTGVSLTEAYKGIKQLEKFFGDVEVMK